MPALGQRRHTEGAGASCQRPGTRHVLKKETLDGSAGSGESDARNGGVGRFGGTEVEADGHGFRSVRVTPRHTAGALWPHHTSAVPHRRATRCALWLLHGAGASLPPQITRCLIGVWFAASACRATGLRPVRHTTARKWSGAAGGQQSRGGSSLVGLVGVIPA